ncbi:MAG: mercury resistance system periplasmic binding protein MerP [Sphingopyxis sp.]|jgi:mercuric ion binding protein|uniref:mercury resistance system periplasmic binding protein MerP n=1 Tax=Sphingopyxis sp. TaxID=1908224 RepID=UPI003F6F0E51
MMKKLTLLAAAAVLFASGPAFAAIRTVTLAVENMTCATCGPVVKKSLSRVPGVTAVEVSAEAHTATVTYDDAKASTKALIAATTNAGYPSQVRK